MAQGGASGARVRSLVVSSEVLEATCPSRPGEGQGQEPWLYAVWRDNGSINNILRSSCWEYMDDLDTLVLVVYEDSHFVRPRL